MGLDLLAFKAMGPTLSPQTPVSSARVHFVNPADAIEVFVDDFTVKIPKGFYVLQAYEVAGIDILLQFGSRLEPPVLQVRFPVEPAGPVFTTLVARLRERDINI
ncbi:NADH dehydrogenase [ubiquinone] iron-sulfur protein 1, mitochondrial [Trifolium repens]|nr:NADH dehydrogenase [ubiquinone] iron-sulfur protein 1, mitochondrial [Trifolium repens]